MHYYIKALRNYTEFTGRATRPEFWYFVLISVIIQCILSILDGMFGWTYMDGQQGVLTTIYNLAVLLPTLAVGVRRMHDIDKSGWFVIIPIYNIILACQPGTAGPNRFGPAPLGTPAVETVPPPPVQ